jgi:hypothetical protein
MEPSRTGNPKPNRRSREVLFHPIRLAASLGLGPALTLYPALILNKLILNKLMDVFFTKLPQALSFCRAKFYLGSGVKLRPSGRRYKPCFATIFLGQGFLLTY